LAFSLFLGNLRAVFSVLLESFSIQRPQWWIEKWNSERQWMQCACGAIESTVQGAQGPEGQRWCGLTLPT
jgi:hypothetical protein